jgi:hypothetical protein
MRFDLEKWQKLLKAINENKINYQKPEYFPFWKVKIQYYKVLKHMSD